MHDAIRQAGTILCNVIAQLPNETDADVRGAMAKVARDATVILGGLTGQRANVADESMSWCFSSTICEAATTFSNVIAKLPKVLYAALRDALWKRQGRQHPLLDFPLIIWRIQQMTGREKELHLRLRMYLPPFHCHCAAA